MKLSALTFSLYSQSAGLTEIPKPLSSLQALIFYDLAMLWQFLQSQKKYRDNGEKSQQINKKELAKKQRKIANTPKAQQQFQQKINELIEIYIGLNKLGYKEFIKRSYRLIDRKYSQNATIFLAANQLLTAFVGDKNKRTRLKHGYYPAPITIKNKVKQNPYRIKPDWIKHGKKITQVVQTVLAYWHSKDFYHTVNDSKHNQQEVIGWLVFSGIVFGGINDHSMLVGWLATLLNGNLTALIDYRVIANVRFRSEHYGNERDSTLKRPVIYNSQQICVDLVSQMWLYTVRQIPPAIRQFLMTNDIEALLLQVLTPVLPEHLASHITFKMMLDNASYYWEVLDDVSIDQTLVGVLQGVEKTTGLRTQDFDTLFFGQFEPSEQAYDLANLVQPPTTSKKTISDTALASHAKIRHSDLIAEIRQIFRKKYDRKRVGVERLTQQHKLALHIEDLTHLLTTFDHISEQILIEWIISLLSGKKPILTASAEKYLSAIGYDWLYYTLGEDVLNWDVEDFETVYEQILDFKRLELGNEAIHYPAGRLQQLHQFAHQKFGIVKVDIPEASADKKVRAEWISPTLYHAILQQLRQCVDSLEVDMLVSLFILLMRTGMRKLELLGLRYSDIENIEQGQPAIIVRPNQHRRLKTDVSIRRIPLNVVLLPAELTFVLEYLQSNRSNNRHQLVFTLSSSHERLPNTLPNRLLDEILQRIDPRATHHTIHGFRHTAISNFSLLLNADIQLASALTGFSQSQILDIRTTLLGTDGFNQFGWYLVAGLAGHLSPERGLEYYNHFAVLTATFELTKANPIFSRQLITHLTGRSTQNFNDNNVQVVNNEITLLALRKMLYRHALSIKHSPPLNQLTFGHTAITDSLSDSPTDVKELFRRYGINKLITLLSDLEQGLSDTEISQKLHIPEQAVQTFYERAKAIASIHTTTTSMSKKTATGENLTYPLTVSRFVQHPNKLLPLLLSYDIERRMLHEMLKNATKFRNAHSQDWQWFITLTTSKITINHAKISFKKTPTGLDDFQRFIAIAEQIFTLKWCLYASDSPLNSLDQPKDLMFKLDKNKPTIYFGIKVPNPNYANFQEANTTARAESPSQQTANRSKGKRPYKFKFSALLRFFTYMVLLQDDSNFSIETIIDMGKK